MTPAGEPKRGVTTAIRVVACQTASTCDMGGNVPRIRSWIRRAAGGGADVVVFPEACLVGYDAKGAHLKRLRPEAVAKAERSLTASARRAGIALILGTVRRAARPTGSRAWHNSMLVVDKGGLVRGYCDKLHPAEPWAAPGEDLPLYTVCGVTSCFLVCLDWRFPELLRLAAAAGARVCYHIAKHSDPSCEHKAAAYAGLPVARAAENGIYFISVNPPANATNLPAGGRGGSCIVDPDGNVLAVGSTFGEEAVAADIDPRKAAGAYANRSLTDETPFGKWMMEGVRLLRDSGRTTKQ